MNACASAVQVHQNNLLKFLQKNDPTVTKIMIQIGLSGGGLDNSYQQRHIPKRLADALESNLYVTEIHVELTDFPLPFPDFDFQVERQQQEQQTILSRWEPFIQAMSKRDNLKSVILSGESRLGHSHYHPMFGLCLRAFQVNKSITSIEFIDVVFHNNEICDFLDNATSITKFVLGGGFQLDDNDGYESFAVALQRNSNIQFLDVKYIHSPNHVVVPILIALKSNINLKSLSIGKILFHWAGPLCQLIEETKTLQRLELHDNYDSFTMTWDIGRLNRAIIESESLTELVLFNNLMNLPLRNFSSILLNKSNLNFLSLSNRNLVVGNDPMITALCSCLTRPDSSIKTLEFDTSLYSMRELLRNYTALTDVLQAVCDSTTLESFKIGFDDDLKAVNRKLFPSLILYIPSMKIKELQIVIVTTMSPNIVVSDETTEQLLQSIKNNYTIKKVVCTNSTPPTTAKGGDGGNNKSLFENNRQQIEKLHFYMDRNTRLEQFMKQPKIIDKELWPEGLQLISHRGTNNLYHFLRGGEGQPNLHQLVCGGGAGAGADDDDSQNVVTYHDMDHDMENHDMEEQVEEKKMAAK